MSLGRLALRRSYGLPTPICVVGQRSDKIFITVEIPNAKDVKLKLEPEGKFIFSATKDGAKEGEEAGKEKQVASAGNELKAMDEPVEPVSEEAEA
ncbi:hypothetical protein Ancab_023851 [Ancistrocladus abbreviatus]